MRFTFRFRWVPFIAALIVAMTGVALGEWQRGRAITKEHIAEAMQRRDGMPPLQLPGSAQSQPIHEIEFRHVLARGEFMPNYLLYLDNRPHNGRAGLVLVAPLRLADGNVVLTMRGWFERDVQDRSRVPRAVMEQGEVQVSGTIRRDTGHLLQLGQAAALKPGAIVQNLQPGDFARATGLRVLPFIIEERASKPPQADGLVRDWPPPSSGADRNRGYAFQWYGLAITAVIFFLVTGFRNRSGTKQDSGG